VGGLSAFPEKYGFFWAFGILLGYYAIKNSDYLTGTNLYMEFEPAFEYPCLKTKNPGSVKTSKFAERSFIKARP